MNRKLGRLPHDRALFARLPAVASHLAALRNVPTVVDWSREVAPGSWGMCGNDVLGDCTCAAVAHAIAVWQSYCPPVTFLTDPEVVAFYSAVSGYNPGQPETDQGARCADVLQRWLRQGVACAGGIDLLSAFATIDHLNHTYVRAALWAMGAVYAGVLLHEAQESEAVWSDLTSSVAGGHCVLLVAADDDGLTCVTWGELRRMTWGWWDACAEEAYALLSPRWLAAGRAPQGFPAAALQAEMRMLAAG
jgi:hypothetical protein